MSKDEYEAARTLADIHIRQCNVPALDAATEELNVKEPKTETEV